MGLFTMSLSLAFAIGPWLGAVVLGRFGPATLWTGAFVGGCLSAALMMGVEAKVQTRARIN